MTVPTMDVMGYGKLAFFLDPGGASFAAWQNVGDSDGVLVGEPNAFCWGELMTRDLAGARAFYGELFGWEYADMPMGDFDYTIVKHADTDAAGMMPMDQPQFDGVPPHWMVYFEVADCAAVADRASASGGTVMVPPTDIPVGTFSVLRDPQGGAFSIITSRTE